VPVVFWLSRPPYLRWVIASLVVVGGIAIELRPPTTAPHPFAVETIGIGEQVDESRVRWRDVPVGLLLPVELPMTASRRIEAGEPVLRTATGASQVSGIPNGWWALELDVPNGARAGMTVRVVTRSGTADGIVVEVRSGDFGERTGLVAIPEDRASVVATAVLDSTVAVLIGS
jgi:hypothetical protein